MFYTINEPWFSNKTNICFVFLSYSCMWVYLHFPLHLFDLSWNLVALCANAAPVYAPLYLIHLVAVFVCVVPSIQPVLSVLRYCITGSPLFRCAQVSLCCDWDVCSPHTACHPVIMFLVYQIEAQPAVHSHSPLTHTRAGGQSNTFLAGLCCSCEIRLLRAGVWTSKQGGVKGDLCVSLWLS